MLVLARHLSLVTRHCFVMEPEIARRCPDCGASVRGGSAYCPQCGKALKVEAASASSTAEAAEIPARRITDTGRNASTIDPQESASTPPAAPVTPVQDSLARSTPGESQLHAEAVAATRPPHDDGRSKRQRMTAAARDVVEEKLSPRVEKLRHASNVMLEEAAYDPSLRFVLVAVALVLLSLLLLLLNYLLG